MLALTCSGTACKKSGASNRPESAPPAIADFPVGDVQSYEDEESLFRVELPGTPVESQETDDDPESLVVRHTAQFRDGDSELLLMWNEVIDAPSDQADILEVLDEVAQGWTEAGLEISDKSPDELGPCVARALRGKLEKQPVEGKIAICEDTLIQIVGSGTYVDDARSVFESFEWLD
jgi:hypothetical protein